MTSTRVACAALAVAAALVAPAGPARADAFAYLGDGAPLYAAARPVALMGALQRLGVADLPAVQRLKRQLGGIDPFNPAILAAPGIDVAAPLALSLLEPAGPKVVHTRLAATLRDPATFGTFVDALVASGQVKLVRVDAQSALGKLGVVATGSLSTDTSLVVRVQGDVAVLDVASASDGKKAPTPAELVRRFPWKPQRPFSVARGARRLFAPEAAAVLYVDGRRMQPLLASIVTDESRRELRWAAPGERAAVVAKQRARDKRCAAWAKAPATFDDLALALSAVPEGVSLAAAWGTQGGAPLGGLKLRPVDDAGLDAQLLARDAAAVVALYAANLVPFSALKRSGPFVSQEALTDAINGCDTFAGLTLLVRSWPLALGAFAASTAGTGSPLAAVQQSVGTLRNVVLALRDLGQAGPRFAIAATFDAAARQTLELFLTASGATGAVTTVGKRSPTVYPLTVPGVPRQLAAALEALAGGRLGFTVADSNESLTWAYRAAERQPGSRAPADGAAAGTAPPPLVRVAADMAALAKLGPMLNFGRDEQSALDLLARLRRVDGELIADGDLLRLTLRSPLKQ